MTKWQVRELVRQGRAAARMGERTKAEEFFRQALALDEEDAKAWLGLASVMEDDTERRACLERALALAPDSDEVQVALKKWAPDLLPSEKAEPSPETASAASAAAATAPAGLPPEAPPASAYQAKEGVLFCINHPNIETSLRCKECGAPICARCARSTPVGFICPECLRAQQEVFYTASSLDYIIAAGVSTFLSTISGYIALHLGWLVLFLAPLAGSIIGEAVFRAIGRRRGRWMGALVAGCIVFTALPWMAISLLPIILGMLSGGEAGAMALFSGFGVNLLFQGIYIVLAAGAAIARLR